MCGPVGSSLEVAHFYESRFFRYAGSTSCRVREVETGKCISGKRGKASRRAASRYNRGRSRPVRIGIQKGNRP